MRRWLALLPLIMLTLAALACGDDGTFFPPAVMKVAADPSVAGKAYALFREGYSSYKYDISKDDAGATKHIVYETTDYGQNWHVTTQGWPGTPSEVLSAAMHDEDLYIANKPVWSFPRLVFRSIFFSNSIDSKTFQLPATNLPLNAAFSPADPSVLYIPMGTEGVLVGPNPNIPGAASHPWTLTHNGMTDLHPHTLMIKSSNDGVFFITLVCVALVFLLYAWLLTQIWRYAFPTGEQHRAQTLAGALSIVLGVVAWLAIDVWLLDERIEVSLVMATASVFIMMLSSSGLMAIWLARSRHFTSAFTLRFALTTGLVSLIVPICVLGGLIAQVIITFGVIGFMFYRGCTSRYLETRSATITQWGLDRLAIEITLLVSFLLLPIAGMIFGVFGLNIFSVALEPSGQFAASLYVFVMSLMFTAGYVAWRGKHVLIKKKAAPVIEDGGLVFQYDGPLFQGVDWWSSIMINALGWVVVAGSVSILLIVVQGIVSFIYP